MGSWRGGGKGVHVHFLHFPSTPANSYTTEWTSVFLWKTSMTSSGGVCPISILVLFFMYYHD